jgi:hypothetical protein
MLLSGKFQPLSAPPLSSLLFFSLRSSLRFTFFALTRERYSFVLIVCLLIVISLRNSWEFQIVRNDPLLGTEIRNQNDGLATMIAKAQPFIKSHDLEQRKEGAIKIRLAIERFGKEILVKKRRQEGDPMASITNYDSKNFGDFSNSVYALLTKDPAHPGKLRAAHSYVTPGPHDNTPPSPVQLSTALGDLKKLKRDYLD